ncbi:hypothetical protein [Clostridium sp. BNL1100]|uniref:hypothetical protein n=1 Tax=Clostridium sp. BNL1100 TaxID=755731 RepID=UPI00059F9B7D|nr:hypothetical protein [Clostridium sp. BNL1100]
MVDLVSEKQELSSIFRTIYVKSLVRNFLYIYIYNATSHTVTDKVLYSELLKAVGHIDAHKGTASADELWQEFGRLTKWKGS